MLKVANQEELAYCAAVLPLIEQLGSLVCGGGIVTSIELIRNCPSYEDGWMVFTDEHGKGLCIHLCDVIPHSTHLRRQINFVTYAQKIAGCFALNKSKFTPTLQDQRRCPPSWRVFRVTVRRERILCGVSVPAPAPLPEPIQSGRSSVKFQLLLQAYIEWRGELSIGVSQVFERMVVICFEQSRSGYLSMSGEGRMRVTMSESDADVKHDNPIQVRLDIGAIELTLQQLVGLRAGSTIELQANLPMSCYLRIGASTLAIAELATAEEGLRVTLREIIWLEDDEKGNLSVAL